MVPSGYRPGPGPPGPVTLRVRRAPWSATLRQDHTAAHMGRTRRCRHERPLRRAMNFDNLVAVLAVAAAVPLILAAVPRVRVPGPVLEIVAGIVLGPAVLDLVKPDQAARLVSTIGLAFLLFLAGPGSSLRSQSRRDTGSGRSAKRTTCTRDVHLGHRYTADSLPDRRSDSGTAKATVSSCTARSAQRQRIA